MLFGKTYLKSASILGFLIAFSQPAFAMTCKEFSEMDESAQKEAFEVMGGRENLREEASGADEDEKTYTTGETNELGDPDSDVGGRAAARAAATGSDEDLMVVLKEECDANPEMNFDAMFENKQRG
ncbi:MAG: hypothetical protein AAFN80_00340 [Pseudomonadota bacterium]